MGCVYVATNSHNGKKYVGWCNCLNTRKLKHKRSTLLGSDLAFHNALRKYGYNSFSWSVVYRHDDPLVLRNKEIEVIRKLNTKSPNGYNLTDGGEGITGCTPRTREKLRKARLRLLTGKRGKEFRKKLSAAKRRSFEGPDGVEIRRKLSCWQRGKKLSEEHKTKLRASRKKFLESREGKKLSKRFSDLYTGRRLSLETRNKMSISRLGNKNAARRCPSANS